MRKAIRQLASICAFALLSLTCPAFPARPVPPRLVNDFAGLFTPRQIASLERALVAFDDSTSNQIAVVTVSDLEGYAPSEYATRIGLSWQVGSEKFNNGIVVLVKPKTASERGEAAIAVGYGLEGAIPDAYAKRIIENEMIPRFRDNDYYAGVVSACQVLMKLASGEISSSREYETDFSDLFIAFLFLFLGALVLIAILLKAGGNGNGGGSNGGGGGSLRGDDIARAIIIGNLLGNASRGGGRSYGGGGGFGGGFGGFGGGSFGGGGASGSW